MKNALCLLRRWYVVLAAVILGLWGGFTLARDPLPSHCWTTDDVQKACNGCQPYGKAGEWVQLGFYAVCQCAPGAYVQTCYEKEDPVICVNGNRTIWGSSDCTSKYLYTDDVTSLYVEADTAKSSCCP